MLPRPALVKQVATGKGDTEPKRIDNYFRRIRAMESGELEGALQIIRCEVKESKMLICLEYCDGGSMAQLLALQKSRGLPCDWELLVRPLHKFVGRMASLTETLGGHTCMLPRYLYLHKEEILLGEPMFISEKVERKLHESRYDYDFFAPEMKSSVMDYGKFGTLSEEKMDIWSFGMLLYQLFNTSQPVFNEACEPIFTKTSLSPELKGLITACLQRLPENRPGWKDINLLKLARFRPPKELELLRADN